VLEGRVAPQMYPGAEPCPAASSGQVDRRGASSAPAVSAGPGLTPGPAMGGLKSMAPASSVCYGCMSWVGVTVSKGGQSQRSVGRIPAVSDRCLGVCPGAVMRSRVPPLCAVSLSRPRKLLSHSGGSDRANLQTKHSRTDNAAIAFLGVVFAFSAIVGNTRLRGG
jgi:hypothetical protein